MGEITVRSKASRALAGEAGGRDPDTKLSAAAAELILDGVPDNTRKTYQREWLRFIRWCGDTHREHLPATPETVAEWIAARWTMRGRGGRPTAPATIELSLAVISVAHRNARGARDVEWHDSPTHHPMVKRAYRGYVTRWLAAGHRPDRSEPVGVDDLGAMVRACDLAVVTGIRDRALVLLAFAMMARSSELRGLNIDDVRFVPIVQPDGSTVTGLLVYVAQSKTDQMGEGAETPIVPAKGPRDPVAAMRAWIEVLTARGITSGPLFRVCRVGNRHVDGRVSGQVGDSRLAKQAVEAVIEKLASRAGITTDGARKRKIRPHSLRAGGATAASDAGADTATIARQGRWSPDSPVVFRYIRRNRFGVGNPLYGVLDQVDTTED